MSWTVLACHHGVSISYYYRADLRYVVRARHRQLFQATEEESHEA